MKQVREPIPTLTHAVWSERMRAVLDELGDWTFAEGNEKVVLRNDANENLVHEYEHLFRRGRERGWIVYLDGGERVR